MKKKIDALPYQKQTKKKKHGSLQRQFCCACQMLTSQHHTRWCKERRVSKENTNKKTPQKKKIPSNFSTLFATFFSDPFMLKRSTHVTTQRQHTVYTTTDSSDQCGRTEPPLQHWQKRPSLSTATLTVQFSSVLTHYLLHQGWATFWQ